MDQETIQEFLKQGILGLVIVAIVTGWLNPKPVMERMLAQLVDKDKTIADKERIIVQKDVTINTMGGLLAEKDKVIERLTSDIVQMKHGHE